MFSPRREPRISSFPSVTVESIRIADAHVDGLSMMRWASRRVTSTEQMLENFRFFGAPHLALITTEAELGTYGAVDCGAFVTIFTMAAEALGIATIPQAALAGYSPFLREWFGLPSSRLVVCGISFGFEDREHPANAFRTERAPLDEILHRKD